MNSKKTNFTAKPLPKIKQQNLKDNPSKKEKKKQQQQAQQ